MIAWPITYTDFDEHERTEIFYFHLTNAEVVEWLSMDGDYTLDKELEKIVEKRNGKELIEAVKELIYRSCGEKSIDGRRFIKTPEVKANFMETEAYSVLFNDLLTNAAQMAKFLKGILPKDLNVDIEKFIEETPDEKLPDGIKLLGQKN